MNSEISKKVDRVMICVDYVLKTYPYTLWLCVTLISAWMISDAIRDIEFKAEMPAVPPVQEVHILPQPENRETEMAVLSVPAKSPAAVKPKVTKPAEVKFYATGDDNVDAYVKRFLKVAQIERQKFGIPIAIKIGQGILESQFGTSNTARRANNHFGMKCWDGCTSFINVHDDHPSDKFKVYQSAWESWRDHSVKLNGERYKHLHQLKPTDYKAWARGLKKAGYATDRRYAEKLIKVIERYDLHKYDRDFAAGR